MGQDPLATYRDKRDFDKTPEPAGKAPHRGGNKAPIFVIQKHEASSLHYDLRLEVDGVLKSWAVPKGPSLDPADKRLAVPTEDHPLEYAEFEGTIPAEEYGGGTMMVWDTGTYENIKQQRGQAVPMAEAIENGRVEVRLSGQKVSGGFALVRTGKGAKPRCLLIKMNDEHADRRRKPTSTENESVLSGRTMKQIERDG
jgi:DNA ligase D-like protein (predicted 3'-phosphoesterase)